MSKENLIKFVIFSVIVVFVSAAFFIFAGNSTPVSGDSLFNGQKRLVNSKLKMLRAVYKQGENAVINGTGFRKFEEVTLTVMQDDFRLRQDVLRGTRIVFADEK